MVHLVNLKFVIAVTIIASVLANIPLILLIAKNYDNPRLCWTLFTSTPNRYLWTLLCFPGVLSSTLVAWGILRSLGPQLDEKKYSSLFLFLHPPPVVLVTLLIASFITLWDYYAGNYNNADLISKYAGGAMSARDAILANGLASPNTSQIAISVQHAVTTTPQKAQVEQWLSKGFSGPTEARVYLSYVDNERAKLLDIGMMQSNLVNVWCFSGVVWFTLHLLALSAFIRQSHRELPLNINYALTTVQYLLLFAMYLIAIWTALRGYELHEYNSYYQTDSGESIDFL